VAKKPIRPAGRGSDQFVIRFPEGMRDRVANLAAANGRSMNAELIDRLEKSMSYNDSIQELEKSISDLWILIRNYREILVMHDRKLGNEALHAGLLENVEVEFPEAR
jgi:Arc-like DNA binding dprotein